MNPSLQPAERQSTCRLSALAAAVEPGGAFHTMAAYRQWILCQFVKDPHRTGKMHKYPMGPDPKRPGGWCRRDAHDPAVWLPADEAPRIAAELGDGWGVGFVLTKADPFFLLDIDGALQDGVWSSLAVQLCQQFAGAAIEISQSGTGLHIIGSASFFPDHSCKNTALGLELYTEGRFVALTANWWPL